MITILFFGAVALVLLWAIVSYNTFIHLKNKSKEAWADITVQLKRRYDLIPNVVKTVQGYASHEKDTFEKVVMARNAAMGADNVKDKGMTEGLLTGALKTVFALTENYPDLKANENFMALHKEITDTENKIEMARRYYNGNVKNFNIAVTSFPANLLAGAFNFKEMEFFSLEPGDENAKKAVEIKL